MLVFLVARLQLAGLAFAFLIPVLLMEGRARWRVALIATALVAAFTFGLGDNVLSVLWPEPAISVGP